MFVVIIGYTESHYGGCAYTIRSTSRYIFLFARGAISWRSCLQSCMSLSTTEDEYVAALDASKEAIWLACLVVHLDIQQFSILHSDSSECHCIGKESRVSLKVKKHQGEVSPHLRCTGK